ncbi:putative feruloyl esterase C [Emericellopsis cladophorae]|uniref:Feruloyl esterase C n=1 Tax=Emericellopsis cladophorae TaxID=2686198 RepID=A0A9P9XXT6_9HYPO|nr:putative feruloyl esterase C [Emericellopsis cladophorae]KAI6779415.1 putative feruloyl esterase C [Emericellopsis cladophorae]
MVFLPRLSAAVALGCTVASTVAQSAGCGQQPTLTNGVQTINGREFILQLPDNYDSSHPYHLVFGLHWRDGSMYNVADGNGVEPWYGLAARAAGSAIFVAPNGYNNGWANIGGEDVLFMDQIMEYVENDLCVDQDSRFATGFSWGGGMSYALACSRAAQFRAVSVISGGLISGCDGGNDPIAYLGIHGISDNVLSIDGGVDLANTFVSNNGCQQANVGRPNPGSGSSVRTDFQGCSQPVSFIAFDGGHVAAPLGVGNPLAPDATWDFFMAA